MSDDNDDTQQQEPEAKAAADEGEKEKSVKNGNSQPEVMANAALSPQDRVTILNDKFEIYIGTPLPEFNQGEVKAYRAVARQGQEDNYFALICEKHLISRVHSESIYVSIVHPCLAQMVSSGVAYWPPTNEERYVLIYRNTLGKPILPTGAKPALGWKADTIIHGVVRPMLGVFRDFRDKEFVHGNISPYNFYNGGTDKLENIVVGDCLATPPSSQLPALYEIAERAMASPIGRGDGTIADDLYAFGVSLVVLLRHHDTLEDMDPQEIIQQKIEQGSFTTLTSKERFHGPILDLLRGLLQDDPAQRWTVEEMMAWSEGNRPNSKQSVREKKAPRSIYFDEQKYISCSSLAAHLWDNPAEVVRIVEDQSLEQWLSRSLEDEEKTDNLAGAVVAAREFGSGTGYAERLASMLSIVLDTHAPIRFDNIKARGPALGRVLACSIAKGEDVQNFVKVFTQNIALRWASAQIERNAEIPGLYAKLDAARTFLRQDRLGYGIERCMYALCPEAHCMSDKLKSYYVNSPEAMMDAFEDMCSKNKAPATFLDRHSAAYLFAKDSGSIETYMSDLNSKDAHRRIMGNLKALSTVQKRGRLPGFPHVAHAFLDMLEPVFARYHDREVRERLQSEVQRFAQSGDLVKMATLLDSSGLRSKDREGFRAAQAEYFALTEEYQKLERSLLNKTTFGRATGKNAAAVISCILAAIIIAGAVMMGI